MTAQPDRHSAAYGLHDVTRRFGAVTAVDHVSLYLARGEIHALLGENGAGKSTLMQILFGLYQPDSGSVIMDGAPVRLASPQVAFRHGIGMVHQEFMLVDTLTVAQNVILGLKDEGLFPNMRRVRARVRELATAHGLEVDPDSMVGDLSIGMRQRVEILKLLYRSCRLLILDEPTAVLTGAETAHLLRLLGQLRAQGCTVLLVTHKLAEILEVADRITVIRKGRIIQTVQKGNLVAADLARMMIGREGGPAAPPARQGAMPAGEGVLSVRGGRIHAESPPIGLDIHGGEIVGIAGADGNGQTELAEHIAGIAARWVVPGQIHLAGQAMTGLGIAARRALGLRYIPADRARDGSIAAATLLENAVLGAPMAEDGLWWNLPARRARTGAIMAAGHVVPPDMDLQAGNLSGGNLQKLIVAREARDGPRCMIAVYPTRGLDIGAVEEIWALLRQLRDAGCAIMLISADLDEIMALSDRVAVLYRGSLSSPVRATELGMDDVAAMMSGTGGAA
ncbi:heme ABC transporter ATP-binding protein [Komagataeibacter rhaeticus]|uniref:ABC transporter ATP-binding protein n=1 Tax=Komagataeibacter rhaeticus TaxID=215221 RepID=UPI000D9B48A4|nr:ABC transporter ATP-binding protein [Komagataeibacter rhaeticus]MBL7238685.1 ABC transporter ATP-binding protein [Komagataeibacter rhaeticus]PYD52996.1 heme ABC transporter ATP-binding protein [Komagataeibacter rhaeticus]GBQ09143.1 sugar ABC transporter ATP-binding protein [Komagataeibacter rhaeticus DSM 16663]